MSIPVELPKPLSYRDPVSPLFVPSKPISLDLQSRPVICTRSRMQRVRYCNVSYLDSKPHKDVSYRNFEPLRGVRIHMQSRHSFAHTRNPANVQFASSSCFLDFLGNRYPIPGVTTQQIKELQPANASGKIKSNCCCNLDSGQSTATNLMDSKKTPEIIPLPMSLGKQL